LQERPSRARIEDHCAKKAGATSGFPFGEEQRVFKVGGKIFAVVGVVGAPAKVTFKTEPELALLLRDQYPSIRPARYFDRRYWSTLTCDGTVPDEEAIELLDTSHDIVLGSLKKSDREAIEGARNR
jgi:predicted DNA-binding protein (MmcQ/YjbR family)